MVYPALLSSLVDHEVLAFMAFDCQMHEIATWRALSFCCVLIQDIHGNRVGEVARVEI